ncbi:sugar transporter [Aspergillus uvarum CBS 121591]|uniref:Sugar transporter n=1 Tax=Aspergillus uvarum CBS 121591 TaxID=1448315 RepID=A0A319CLL1_9EURO|nr:sugar transporter [Aspergillus uvarum CBS 121591]PYH86436.1 sugar transporter [Aspergillus uvarum CBS 121591]
MVNEMQNKKPRMSNQSWRKKPRKFAPKSKLGCKTCKIRRIKCDLARPSCVKCFSTGRTCDGYSEMLFTFKIEKTEKESTHHHREIVDRADTCNSYHPRTAISMYESAPWRSNYHALNLHNLGSFMTLPASGSNEGEVMCFFRDVSIKHLNEYRPCESWRNALMFFAQTVPSVRHAVIGLALVHQKYYLNCHSNDQFQYQPHYLKDRLSDQAPLLHYNRAIQLLLNPEKRDSAETTAITLLICYLFTCFDHLAGDNVQAVKHLRGGVALSRSIINNPTSNRYTDDDAPPSGIHAVINQVTQHIRRLDMQAVMFLVDWTPADLQETLTMSRLAAFDNSPFRSLDQAADYLQITVTQVMRLRNTGNQISPTGTMPPLPSSLNHTVRGQLETWLRRFEALLLLSGSSSPSASSDSTTNPLISLLRLQHTIASVLLEGYGPGREMDYDKFLPQFWQCVALASEVAAAHHRYAGSSSRATFTPEIGFIPVLYIVGVKCRHPVVRRQVLDILRRQPMREAAWDSILTARVVGRVIEIEEGGDDAAGQEPMVSKCMEEIPIWQRIEALSYTYIPGERGSAARLEIEYTFCAREGVHIESLIL